MVGEIRVEKIAVSAFMPYRRGFTNGKKRRS